MHLPLGQAHLLQHLLYRFRIVPLARDLRNQLQRRRGLLINIIGENASGRIQGHHPGSRRKTGAKQPHGRHGRLVIIGDGRLVSAIGIRIERVLDFGRNCRVHHGNKIRLIQLIATAREQNTLIIHCLEKSQIVAALLRLDFIVFFEGRRKVLLLQPRRGHIRRPVRWEGLLHPALNQIVVYLAELQFLD